MEELRYIVVPKWIANVVESSMRADYSALLSLDSMLSILSTNDVGFYLAAQCISEFVVKAPESECTAVHLQGLTGGLVPYQYDVDVLPVEKRPDVLCRYVNGYSNGYDQLLYAGPRSLGDDLPYDGMPVYVSMKPVDETTVALVIDIAAPEIEETGRERIAQNYSRVLEHLRIIMSLADVVELPLFQSYGLHLSLYHSLRRI